MIQVPHLAIGLMGCFEVFTSGFAWACCARWVSYINFRQLAINGHQCCVLAHASPLSVRKHALGRKCSLMATPSKRDSVNAQSSSKFRSVDSQILLSGKILRTGFPVQQFHICASRGFLTLMTAKAINDH